MWKSMKQDSRSLPPVSLKPRMMIHSRATLVKNCFARRTVWRYTWGARTLEAVRTGVSRAVRPSAITWASRSTEKLTTVSRYLSARHVGSISNVPRPCLPTCWFTLISGRFLAIIVEKNFTRSRTWKNTCSCIQGRNPTNAGSVANVSANLRISSLTAESTSDSNRLLVRDAEGRSIAKWI